MGMAEFSDVKEKVLLYICQCECCRWSFNYIFLLLSFFSSVNLDGIGSTLIFILRIRIDWLPVVNWWRTVLYFGEWYSLLKYCHAPRSLQRTRAQPAVLSFYWCFLHCVSKTFKNWKSSIFIFYKLIFLVFIDHFHVLMSKII